jgi:hypothetical protein
MQRRTLVWVVCGVVAVLAIVACKAGGGPGTPGGSTGGARSPVMAKPVLYEDERPVGKIVAFKDADEVRSFNDAWLDDVNGGHQGGFFKMAGDEDAGAPTSTTQPNKPKGPPKNTAPKPVPPSAGAAPAPAPAAPPPPPAATSAPRAAPRSEAKKAAPADAPSRSFSDDSVKGADKDGAKDESITNNQHAEVDEGDIVKLHGDHLIVLRRGRLFTISLDGDRLKQSKMLDAFGPDIDPRGSWYDEIVVDGENVVVVGFSYQRGGTEVGLFKIDREGGLTYRSTYHLKSNDYYSARNYASRIVDGRLVFYAPLYIAPQPSNGDFSTQFPAVRKWRRAGTNADFVKTLVPSKLFHMDGEFPATPTAALHTVTTCDLRQPELSCESVGLIGPPGRVFYVSPSAVYVWMQDYASGRHEGPRKNGLVARLPIGRTTQAPAALRVAGMPTDQFSFEEDDTGFLNVLVRAESNGDAMFASEHTAGATALLRIPLGMFADDVLNTSVKRYRVLPRPDGGAVQNRFTNGWLLYGSGQGYVTNHQGQGRLYAVRYASPDDPPTTVDLDQGVDRIEPMGEDAVIVGSRGADLVFTPLELGSSKEAHARRDFVRKNASQGELRSHGFFYKPGKGPREGIVGLPIRSEGTFGGQYLREGSASVLFLQAHALEFTELGSLRASRLTSNHDGCRASCVDWYGNARPIFAKGRIFALMGYDLVEGRVETDGRAARLSERMRLDFTPHGGPPAEDFD